MIRIVPTTKIISKIESLKYPAAWLYVCFGERYLSSGRRGMADVERAETRIRHINGHLVPVAVKSEKAFVERYEVGVCDE